MKKKFSETQWVKIDTPTIGDQFKGVSQVLLDKDLLISSHRNIIKVWDVKNIPEINLVATLERINHHTKIKKKGDLLYLFGRGVQIINISDIKNPVVQFTSELSTVKNGCSAGDVLYVNHEKDNDISLLTQNDEITKLFTIHNDNYFRSYPSDIDIFEDLIFVVGRHSGLSIYKLLANNSVEHLSTHKVGYTPTDIHWEIPGQRMLLVGNEDVIRYDISDPRKPKRSKSCKLKNVELAGQYVRRDDEIIVAGLTLENEKPILGIVELAKNELRLLKTQKIINYDAEKVVSDGMEGMVCKDNYLMLFTYYRGMGLFKAE